MDLLSYPVSQEIKYTQTIMIELLKWKDAVPLHNPAILRTLKVAQHMRVDCAVATS
ncbi:hypothetical protein FOXYSP1_06686 [Fusarium oxysporum f. sp. phaseoli]